MPPGGNLKVRSSISRLSPKALAEPLRHRDDDLGGLRAAVGGFLQQFLVALIARLGFCLPGARARRNPFALAIERAPVGLVLAALLHEPFLLLLEPGGVIALVGNAAPAVELEDPAGHMIEEVAIMGDDEDRARIFVQVAFEPGDRLRIEVVGGLVEQQKLGLLQEEPAERDPPPLAARELGNVGIVGRAAQRVHRQVDLGIEIPQPLGLDLVLQLGHLVRGLVGIVHRQLVVAVEHRLLGGKPQHHVLAHGLVRIELRLLRQVADAGPLGHPGLAGELLVEPGHDPQQGRLAGAVDTEHADLGVRIERQVDVLQDLPVSRVSL
jgi:hypothetical protein